MYTGVPSYLVSLDLCPSHCHLTPHSTSKPKNRSAARGVPPFPFPRFPGPALRWDSGSRSLPPPPWALNRGGAFIKHLRCESHDPYLEPPHPTVGAVDVTRVGQIIVGPAGTMALSHSPSQVTGEGGCPSQPRTHWKVLQCWRNAHAA